MNKTIIAIVLFLPLNMIAQTPLNDNSWEKVNTYSDNFNLTKHSNWFELTGSHWGIGIFRTTEIKFSSEGSRQYLQLEARAESGTYYTGGIGIHENGSPFGYGYYEIEARLNPQSGIQTGFWPAFWTVKSWKTGPPYWYEEIDIFEPGACEVLDGTHQVGFWHEINEYNSSTTYNREKYRGYSYNLEMNNWHRYAVEWLPDRIVFYLDGEPFYRILASDNKKIPYHEGHVLYIDLQIHPDCSPSISNGYLGSFDINFFGYYELNLDCKTIVNDISDFSTYDYAVKKSISLGGATTIPTNSKITLRATDFLELNAGIEIPIGAEFVLYQSDCN